MVKIAVLLVIVIMTKIKNTVDSKYYNINSK